MTIIIGLTGSIGTGKSTVSRMFQRLKIPVVDADKIAREVVEPSMPAYEAIVATFGKSIIRSDQTIDRKKLGAIIFSDESKRKQLNNIIHPAIRKEMLRQKENYISKGHMSVVLDIPLLFESKLTHYVDKILVVYVDPKVQLERIMKRDGSTENDARQRISSQISIVEKVKLADAVIDNNGTIEESFEQLKRVLSNWKVNFGQ